jgi:hypothetical protein
LILDECHAESNRWLAIVPGLIVPLNQGLSPASRDDLGRARRAEQEEPACPIGVTST